MKRSTLGDRARRRVPPKASTRSRRIFDFNIDGELSISETSIRLRRGLFSASTHATIPCCSPKRAMSPTAFCCNFAAFTDRNPAPLRRFRDGVVRGQEPDPADRRLPPRIRLPQPRNSDDRRAAAAERGDAAGASGCSPKIRSTASTSEWRSQPHRQFDHPTAVQYRTLDLLGDRDCLHTYARAPRPSSASAHSRHAAFANVDFRYGKRLRFGAGRASLLTMAVSRSNRWGRPRGLGRRSRRASEFCRRPRCRHAAAPQRQRRASPRARGRRLQSLAARPPEEWRSMARDHSWR